MYNYSNFQGIHDIAWVTKEHNIEQRYQVHGSFLENPMEEAWHEVVV